MEADCALQSAVVGSPMGMVGGSERQHGEAGGMGYGGDVVVLVMDGGKDTD